MQRITSFQHPHRWLSNFWPCEVVLEGLKFPHVEGAYVAAKTKDISIRKQVQKIQKPGDCKRFGRTFPLREDWDSVKLEIMEHLLRQKFERESNLADKLISTFPAKLMEGNSWGDTFWGVCRGKGENHLGKILMKIRSELKQ